MSHITVVSKQPPGGRCSLYMRFAEVLNARLGGGMAVLYCDPKDGGAPREAGKPEGDEARTEPAVPPPALRIGDLWVSPSDGVIISPQDIAATLAGRLPGPEVAALTRELDAALDLWMEEWAPA